MCTEHVFWEATFGDGCELSIKVNTPIGDWVLKFPGGIVVTCPHGNKLKFIGKGTEDNPVLQVGKE